MNENRRKSTSIALDELDMRICHEMVTNGQQSSREIGQKLGVPHATVRRRMNRLISNDIVHLVAMPNPTALGYHRVAGEEWPYFRGLTVIAEVQILLSHYRVSWNV